MKDTGDIDLNLPGCGSCHLCYRLRSRILGPASTEGLSELSFPGSLSSAKLGDLWVMGKGVAFWFTIFQVSCFLSPLVFLFRETQPFHALQQPECIEAWGSRGTGLINMNPANEYESANTVTIVGEEFFFSPY